ncbi:MAG: prolipoprotein diacylglyceryl transferase [Anaerolineales bacterium]|nr:prolipoprotein diacylglyceryl transferase [Anaerolineales bacterium]
MITQPLFLGTFSLYSIILSGTVALGLFLSWWIAEDKRTFILDAGLGIILTSLLGARVGFVLRNLVYFLEHPGQMPQFWLGGLSWPGALIGAGLAVVGIHLIWKEPLGELADQYLPLLGMMAFGTWLVSWGTGIGYGPEVEAWYGILVQDLYGLSLKRWPLPILGALLSGGWTAGVILFPIKRQRDHGFRALTGTAGLLAINGVISFFKIDPVPVLWGLRWESWFSLISLAIIMIYLFMARTDEKDEGSNP